MKKFIYSAVFFISASVLIFETILLKFSLFKMSPASLNSSANLIISTVFLGFGAAGTYIYLKTHTGIAKGLKFSILSDFSVAYAITIPISIILFAYIPFFESGDSLLKDSLSVIIHAAILSIPFFFAGVCISCILFIEEFHVGRVIFFDLMGAAFGCIVSVLSLRRFGAYGVAMLAVISAYLSAVIFTFFQNEMRIKPVFKTIKIFLPIFACIMLVAYPKIMRHFYQFDIVYTPAAPQYDKLETFKRDFRYLQSTYWNPIGRVDLSKEGESNDHQFLYGLSERYRNKKYKGRIIVLTPGGVTRQFMLNGNDVDKEFLGHFLYSIPYRLKDSINDILVVGPGGGVDILIAKHFGVKHIDATDINPDIIDILKGKNKNDEMSSMYSRLTLSDAKTEVKYYAEEGRSFISKNLYAKYDIVQLSGDIVSLSALMSGSMVLPASYLYTQEAIKCYYDVLKENGYLQLFHWGPPQFAFRLFITSLEMLEREGVRHPERSLAVISCRNHTLLLMKKGRFSDAEINEIRSICVSDQFKLLFIPRMPFALTEDISNIEIGSGHYFFASLSKKSREKILQNASYNLRPAYDDKPFFYSVYKFQKNNFLQNLPMGYKVAIVLSLFGLIASFAFILLPIMLKQPLATHVNNIPLNILFSFWLAGIAFSLAEISLIQKFNIFVGGPFYSMCIVLPAVLIACALGALWISKKNNARSASLLAIAVAGIILYGIFGYMFFDKIFKTFFGIGHFGRVILSMALIFPLGFFIGFPLPIILQAIKHKFDKSIIPWAWGINSCGSVIGALAFPIVSQATGFNLLLLISCFAYLIVFILLFPGIACGKEVKSIDSRP